MIALQLAGNRKIIFLKLIVGKDVFQQSVEQEK